MEEERYIFSVGERMKRGFIHAFTNIWVWAAFLVGAYFAAVGDTVGVVLLIIALIAFVVLFFIGLTNGTSLVFTATDITVEDKKQGWVSFPYDKYHIELSEQKRSINMFTISVKRHIYFYSLPDNQLVYTANALNIPSKKFKKLEWMIRDSKISTSPIK